MTQTYTGNRKGISLVEMMITVILFAVLSTIGLKYYRNYFDTALSSQKARIAALMDQGTQLANAYDVYTAQEGTAPLAITDLNSSTAKILTKLPDIMTELSTARWDLNRTTGFGSGIAFHMYLDLNGTSYATSGTDDMYCAIFNREFNSSITLDANNTTVIMTPAAHITAGHSSFCSEATGNAAGSTKLDIWVMKP